MALLLSLLASGCRGWTPIPTDRIGTREAVRIRTVEGEEIRLTDPQVLGDSVVVGWAVEPGPGERSVPLGSIEEVEAYGTSPSATVQLVLVTATVAGIWGFVRLFSDDGGVS